MKQTSVEWLEKIRQGQKEKPFDDYEWEIAFNHAKEMEKEQMLNTSKINRVEVIQHSEPYNGRAYANNNAKDVEIQFQDNNETLKIFLK